MTNRLAGSQSSYLLQHQHNPVDWWPWCDAAFEEAKRRDVPVFLSIGYASCHWCHVMAHESFEDLVTARQLAEGFVSIKVDREERPDIDAVYMAAVQGLTGQGGWPLSVFLDHERRPFYGGTYFPPTPKQGMPSFSQVLTGVSDIWHHKRAEVSASAAKIQEALGDRIGLAEQLVDQEIDLELVVNEALTKIAADYDSKNGGFGGAPKFPPTTSLEFLIRMAAHGGAGSSQALNMTKHTCEAMIRGGIYDQLGGGFARYAIDGAWRIPHFEKMLYDNALLLRIYVHLYRLDRNPLWARVIRETAQFLLRDLRTSEGGFASALDADALDADALDVDVLDADALGRIGASPAEGRSYIWTSEQLGQVLAESDAELAATLLGVTKFGNFEGSTSVLTLSAQAESQVRNARPDDYARWWARVRTELWRARERRPQPERDEKIVAAWNGYAIAALAEAGAVCEVPEWIEAATVAAELLKQVHIVDPGNGQDHTQLSDHTQLIRVSRAGTANKTSVGVLEDYAAVAEAFIVLSGVTGADQWRELAGELLDTVLAEFVDHSQPDSGMISFFDTASRAEKLIVRPGDPTDVATPSGWAQAVLALQAYGTAMADPRYLDAAGQALQLVALLGPNVPRFAGTLLSAAVARISGPLSVVVVGPEVSAERSSLTAAAVSLTNPGAVISTGLPAPVGAVSPFAGRPMLAGRATVYVCRGTYCLPPIHTEQQLQQVALGEQ